MASNLEHFVTLAKDGNKQAMETVVGRIQDRIYGLALRMLGRPEDAEDQTQEILIKIITHLSSFREESAFSSWVYRIACNHLLTARKRTGDEQCITFEFLEEMFTAETGKPYALAATGPERDLLLEETRLECMQTVLACLEGPLRIVYILGEIFGVTSKEGAYILEITPDAFRQRLSRGRRRIQGFMLKHCGMVDQKNSCRCHKQAARKLELGPAAPPQKMLVLKEKARKNRTEAVARLKELAEIDRTATMFRRYPRYRAPESFTHIVKDLISSGKYPILLT